MKGSITIHAILFCLIILLTGGCSRRSVVLKYYLIEPMAITDSLDINPGFLIDAICEVKPVEIFTAFATTRIAHRNESHEITYYGYHQWAVTPETEMTQILVHFLKHQNIFRNVSTRFWKLATDYFLETTVYQLETVQNERSLSARLNIDFRLTNATTNEVILTHSADRIEPLAQNDMNLFAAAISRLYNEEIHNLTLKIKQNLPIQ
jgi:ABC-type uncharacterized transport system auxiliary subunit